MDIDLAGISKVMIGQLNIIKYSIMKTEIINLTVLFVFGILYLIAFSKIQEKYFLKFGYPNRPFAVTILLLGSIIAASINMVHIAELAAAANRFFIGQSEIFKMLLFSLCFYTGMWIFHLFSFI